MKANPDQPRSLHIAWWLFSPTYRTYTSPRRAEKVITGTMREQDVSRAQAVAFLAGEVEPELRDLVRRYREGGN